MWGLFHQWAVANGVDGPSKDDRIFSLGAHNVLYLGKVCDVSGKATDDWMFTCQPRGFYSQADAIRNYAHKFESIQKDQAFPIDMEVLGLSAPTIGSFDF